MDTMNKTEGILLGTATISGAASAGTVFSYRHALATKKAWLRAGSRIAQTTRGPTEYTFVGQGPPMLVLHGGFSGGYDQGLTLARVLHGAGVSAVVPSRFGYLRTPIPRDGSHRAQAASYVALLDTLRIARVGVLAFSAGGPSALEFVLQYPERCWGLILVSAVGQPGPPIPPLALPTISAGMNYGDFALWMALKTMPLRLLMQSGMSPTMLDQVKTDPHKRELLHAIAHTVFPMSLRRKGMLNDLCQPIPRFPFHDVQTPTHVIHGALDPNIALARGIELAQRIPGASLQVLSEGGHFCYATHFEEVQAAVANFVDQHRPQCQPCLQPTLETA